MSSSSSESKDRLKELEAILHSRPPEKQSIQMITELAEAYFKAKKYWDARKWFMQALTRSQQVSDHSQNAHLHYQMARVLGKQRQWADAQYHFEQALFWKHDQNQLKNLYKTHHQLGRVLQEQQEWLAAREHYQAALSHNQTKQDRRFWGLCNYQLGQVCQALNDVYPAMEAYQTALQHLTQDKYPQQRAEIYYQLGDLLSKINEPGLARQSFEAGLSIWQTLDNKTWLGMSWLKLALLSLSESKLKDVLKAVPQAIEYLEQTQEYSALKMAYELFAELKQLHSEHDEANLLLAKAHEAEQNLKQMENQKRKNMNEC